MLSPGPKVILPPPQELTGIQCHDHPAPTCQLHPQTTHVPLLKLFTHPSSNRPATRPPSTYLCPATAEPSCIRKTPSASVHKYTSIARPVWTSTFITARNEHERCCSNTQNTHPVSALSTGRGKKSRCICQQQRSGRPSPHIDSSVWLNFIQLRRNRTG